MDVDSTVWDTGARVREVVYEITGQEMDVEAVTDWTGVLDLYGEETTMSIFEQVLSPARVADREPYADAPMALRRLQGEGVNVHFVTRNWDPEAMEPCLGPWLREHFGEDVGLTVLNGDKLPVLLEVEAFGVIDDRPDTIERAADAGLWTATMLHPWNREVVAARADVHGFAHWREVSALLPPRGWLRR